MARRDRPVRTEGVRGAEDVAVPTSTGCSIAGPKGVIRDHQQTGDGTYRAVYDIDQDATLRRRITVPE